MLDKLLREPLARLASPAARAMTRLGLSANAITLMGTCIVAGGSFLVAIGRPALGGWILFAGVLFDILDGLVAKGSGRGGPRGAFLDSTTDRVADGFVFSAIAWSFARTDSLGLALALSAGVLAFLTSYIRARAEGLGVDCRVGVAERPERMTLVITGLILDLLVPALIILVVLALVTVVQRFICVWTQVREPTRP
jgi:CDP-diacylglycerol--glycerol-3-phosphate 3-phosphatidyltransferase